MSQKDIIHPEISSLIRRRDEIYQMLLSSQYPLALEAMDLLILELRKDDQDPELLSEIRKHKSALKIGDMNGTSGLALRMNLAHFYRGEYFDLYRRLCNILWTGNYLIFKKYSSFWDPSGGGKSGDKFGRGGIPKKT
jgi:hypothetical protein